MRKSFAILLILIVALTALYSCKSRETTSAILHNNYANYEKAIEMAELALKNNPSDAEAHFQLGISYSNTKRMGKAYGEFMAAVGIDPKRKNLAENNIKHNWAKHFNSGLAEFQAQNLAGAAVEFEQSTLADPRQVKGWLNLAKVYNMLSQDDSTYLDRTYETVDTLMARATPQDESYSNILALSGRVMLRRGMDEQAYEIFENLMLDDPANFEIVESVGGSFLRRKDWENAAKYMEMSVDGRRKTDSEEFEPYYNIGIAYYNLKNYFKAIEAYQNALLIRPGDKQTYYNLLLTYYQAEMWDESVMLGQEYTTSIAPDDPRGWQILGLSYSKKNMKMKAEEATERYRELLGQ